MDAIYFVEDQNPNTELYHHGTKGQKWGVRRFQNADGSLTAEGYQHYGVNPDGSRFKQRGGGYSNNTASKARKGGVTGTAAAAALGFAVGGPMGAVFGASAGALGGAMLGTAVGAIDTSRKRKKIRKLLDEKGKVYVKDL